MPPLAIAAAISPFPIVGVVLMLATFLARINGPGFGAAWTVGVASVGPIGCGTSRNGLKA